MRLPKCLLFLTAFCSVLCFNFSNTTSAQISQPAATVRLPYWSYPYQLHTSTQEAIAQIVRWLIRDHASIVGPSWSLIECYDGALGVAPKRRVPANAHDLDSLPGAGNVWPLNIPGIGDWCMVESRVGRGGNKTQVLFIYTGAAVISLIQCGEDDFVPGGVDATPPALPADCVGAGVGGLVAMASGDGRYTLEADQSHFQFWTDIGGVRNWTYIGETDECRDSKCFIIWDTPATFYVGQVAAFNRWDASVPGVLSTGYPVEPMSAASLAFGPLRNAAGHGDPGTAGGYDICFPVWIQFDDAPGYYVSGRLRNTCGADRSIGTLAQTTDKRWICSASAASRGDICTAFDGATTYVGAAGANLHLGGYYSIGEAQY
jgi:hypothetical protein